MDTLTSQPLPIGGIIQEFRIVRVLGAGTFGIVYQCENTFLPEQAAIKEFLPMDLAGRLPSGEVRPLSDASKDGFLWARDRFLQEAKTLWNLGQPDPQRNIVRVTRFCEANGTAYMFMAFERGRPLSALLEERDTLPCAELKQIIFPLLDGLERVHEAAVVHRDIKPANILIRADGSPVLIDFGAARQIAGGERSVISAYTPNYAAMEQVHAVGEQGPWTDIYAMGATLYRAISGSPPPNVSERAVGAVQMSAVRAGLGRYPEAFLAAIDAACALDPKKRPQSVPDWRKMLVKGPEDAALVYGISGDPDPGPNKDFEKACAEATATTTHLEETLVAAPSQVAPPISGSAVEETTLAAADDSAGASASGYELDKTVIAEPPRPGAAASTPRSRGALWALVATAAIALSAGGFWFLLRERSPASLRSPPPPATASVQIETDAATPPEKAEMENKPVAGLPSSAIAERPEGPAENGLEAETHVEPKLVQEPEPAVVHDDAAEPVPEIVRPGERFRDSFLDGRSAPSMVWLPGGAFQMGSPASEPGRNTDELLHRAEVRSMVAMGETEVTVGQFTEFTQATGYRSQVERETSCLRMDDASERLVPDMSLSWREPGFDTSSHHPVTCITWNDAWAYADWLSAQTGQLYRLPTELEWEYAARAGSSGSRFWGNDADAGCEVSNTADGTVLQRGGASSQIGGSRSGCRDDYLFAAPVGVLEPNDFGLHDMLGNLAEWTCSGYDEGYAGGEARCVDQEGSPESGPRVIRGGSWLDAPTLVRSAARDGFPPHLGLNTIGFRVARDLGANEIPASVGEETAAKTMSPRDKP